MKKLIIGLLFIFLTSWLFAQAKQEDREGEVYPVGSVAFMKAQQTSNTTKKIAMPVFFPTNELAREDTTRTRTDSTRHRIEVFPMSPAYYQGKQPENKP